MAVKLGCIMETIKELRVVTANGNELRCNETCKNFSWKMQGQMFEAEMLPYP